MRILLGGLTLVLCFFLSFLLVSFVNGLIGGLFNSHDVAVLVMIIIDLVLLGPLIGASVTLAMVVAGFF